MNNTDDLLTIKQAAKLLNVSEMSLRRWTNSGKLACVRVGAHRSRRFQREDLMQFLEKQEASPPVESSFQHKMPTQIEASILLEGISINYGSHLCSLYDNITGLKKLAVPLLAEGLKNNDVCFLVAKPAIQSELINELQIAGCRITAAIDSKQLIITDGESNKEKMLKYLQENFNEVSRRQNKSMRLVGDMSWAIEKGWSLAEILDYESIFNSTLGHQFPIVSLCQYDVNVFSGAGVLGALRCHEDTFDYPLNRFCGVVEH